MRVEEESQGLNLLGVIAPVAIGLLLFVSFYFSLL
jgi:hypothetical protein